jgi:hydrogenase nickel incorporation protein HypA/HybF
VHELSIAQSLIDLASEAAAREESQRVTRLHIQIGALAGVVKEALLFSFELAAVGTPCEGATLEIDDIGVTMLCPECRETKIPSDLYSLCCPACGTLVRDVLTGRELDLISVEVDTHVAAHH